MPYRFGAGVKNPEKTNITRDFAAATGHPAMIYDPQNPGELIPNPVTKAKWLDDKIDAYVRAVVRDYRLSVARAEAEAAAVADMASLES